MKTFTGNDIIDAIEKNGYIRTEGTLVSHILDDEGNFTDKMGACAWGQMLINLGVKATMRSTDSLVPEYQLYRQVYMLNDTEHMTPKEIAAHLRKKWTKKIKETIFEGEEYDWHKNYPRLVKVDASEQG